MRTRLLAIFGTLVVASWLGCDSDSSNGARDVASEPVDDSSRVGDGVEDDTSDTSDEPDAVGPPDDPAADRAVAVLSATAMKGYVDFLSSDDMAGRIPGSPGHRAARDYLRDEMAAIGLEPFGDDDGWFHTYPTTPRTSRFQRDEDGEIVPASGVTGYNIVGIIPGSDDELSDEYIVLLAHYDHVGVEENGAVNNGAFDNAGGVAVLLDVSRALIETDAAPRRSIVILISDEEEAGLLGAENWIADPPVAREQIIVGLSADPVGRRMLPDYDPIVLSGLERSPELLAFWRQTEAFTDNEVIYIHRRMIPGFASDQDEFHAQGVSASWFVTPGMSFYHTVNDTADTIDYRMMLDAARYMTRSVRFIGNSDRHFEYVGEPDLNVQHAHDVRNFLVGVLSSSFPDAGERGLLEQHLESIDQVIEFESWDVISSPDAFFIQVVGFMAFALPQTHPGEIPPPFPED